jgi:hypothetical protein
VADIAKAALRNRVLEHLGVLAAGETAASADQTLVDEAIDAAHDTLRSPGLVPFPTSAIPSWAQLPLRDWVAAAVGRSYGKSWSDAEIRAMKRIAADELAKQVAGFKHNARIRGTYF